MIEGHRVVIVASSRKWWLMLEMETRMLLEVGRKYILAFDSLECLVDSKLFWTCEIVFSHFLVSLCVEISQENPSYDVYIYIQHKWKHDQEHQIWFSYPLSLMHGEDWFCIWVVKPSSAVIIHWQLRNISGSGNTNLTVTWKLDFLC